MVNVKRSGVHTMSAVKRRYLATAHGAQRAQEAGEGRAQAVASHRAGG